MSDMALTKKNISLQVDSQPVTKEKLKEVADLYEKHFLKEMMKQMKSTTSFSDEGLLKKNNAEKIFQEQLDDEYTSQWNKTGTFGLSDMIYNQLLDRYGNELGQKPLEKPQGPIDLSPKKNNIENLETKGQKGLSFKIHSPTDINFNQSVKSPWAGTLQSKQVMDDSTSVYKLKHDNGLESLISIRGAASEKSRFLSAGDTLKAGEEIALADSTSPLFWTVNINQNKV